MDEDKLDLERLNYLMQKARSNKILRNACIVLFLFVAFIVVSDAITYYNNSDKYECDGMYCHEIVNESNLTEPIDELDEINIQIPNYLNNTIQ